MNWRRDAFSNALDNTTATQRKRERESLSREGWKEIGWYFEIPPEHYLKSYFTIIILIITIHKIMGWYLALYSVLRSTCSLALSFLFSGWVHKYYVIFFHSLFGTIFSFLSLAICWKIGFPTNTQINLYRIRNNNSNHFQYIYAHSLQLESGAHAKL